MKCGKFETTAPLPQIAASRAGGPLRYYYTALCAVRHHRRQGGVCLPPVLFNLLTGAAGGGARLLLVPRIAAPPRWRSPAVPLHLPPPPHPSPPPRAGQRRRSGLQAVRPAPLPAERVRPTGRLWTAGVLPTAAPLSRSARVGPVGHAGRRPAERGRRRHLGESESWRTQAGRGDARCPEIVFDAWRRRLLAFTLVLVPQVIALVFVVWVCQVLFLQLYIFLLLIGG